MVSRAGYTREAISLAKDAGIGTLSLLPEVGSDIGFAIGFQSYVRFFEWTRLEVTVQAKEDLKLDGPLDIEFSNMKSGASLTGSKRNYQLTT